MNNHFINYPREQARKQEIIISIKIRMFNVVPCNKHCTLLTTYKKTKPSLGFLYHQKFQNIQNCFKRR